MKLTDIPYSIYYKLISPNKFTQISGVKMDKNCNLMTKYFGNEPYLITLGDSVATSGNVQFVTHDGSLHVLRNLFDECKNKDLIQKIIIGNNVFIGLNAIILPGSIIEDNTIIGAGSLVKGHLRKNSVYAGVPAKFICTIDEYKTKNKGLFIETKSMTGLEKRNYLQSIGF